MSKSRPSLSADAFYKKVAVLTTCNQARSDLHTTVGTEDVALRSRFTITPEMAAADLYIASRAFWTQVDKYVRAFLSRKLLSSFLPV